MKVDDNKCYAKAFWQNEFVMGKNYDCPTFESGIGLYIAGDAYYVLNGQIRNFSYIKK